MHGRSTRLRWSVLLLLCGALTSGGDASAATLMVTTTADSGPGSLRQAILDSNASAGTLDTIVFAVTGAGCAGAACTITPLTPLPPITDSVHLDGSTQPGFAGMPLIQILTSSLTDGLVVSGGSSTVIIRLAICGFNTGIRLSGGSAVLLGNWIGLKTDGTQGGNFEGIHVSSSGNGIGGLGPTDGNVIATNLYGILFDSGASNNSILGNFVGTDPTGTIARPNGSGVSVDGFGNVVGGTVSGARNVISGNGGTALSVAGLTNIVQGNLIGTDVTGTLPLPNGGSFPTGSAVGVAGSSHLIGGVAAGAANVVAFNAHAGIIVTNGGSHRISENSIHDNGGLGIDLGGDGVTPNDPHDLDSGPNGLQNYPVLTSALVTGSTVSIAGTLAAADNGTFRIEFFGDAGCDPSGYGEGKIFLGSTDVSTDALGNASFGPLSFAFPAGLGVVTATAMDPLGNTSEFSACLAASSPVEFFTIAPCRLADTRGVAGPYGGPALAANADRTFVVGGHCGIPASAAAVSFNFTITQSTGAGDLRVFPASGGLPLVSTLNWRTGQTRANNAVVGLGPAGDLTVHPDQATGTVHLVIDVNGYFQ